ncbi:MAG: 50S ribosomal protein L24 [Candidatus Pacebacteria bacterium]|nr:50S ribosomal protein L24 [Candidatus Paceibacterota bacterium]
MKLKKSDTVLIISGKYRGKKGKILSAYPKSEKILVEGINLKKKHQRPKKEGEKGQIVEIPFPMEAACAKLVCPKCGEATRVGYKVSGGKKYRVCKKCSQEI